MRTRIPYVPQFSLVVRREVLTRIRQLQGIASEAELARLMGINEGQLNRVLLGKCNPGERFIAQILGVVGFEWVSQVFALVRQAEEDVA